MQGNRHPKVLVVFIIWVMKLGPITQLEEELMSNFIGVTRKGVDLVPIIQFRGSPIEQ